ncbi:thiol-disulfide oxidoreductase DCC family protein [Streptomyces sp. BI20]|uniref:thiol-disulfide oxidoreductase DCC family protein n=1 Tax=Streptomyces sp. BI20 TaxID=3403460 RepID=UPI003C71D117
MTSRPAPTPPPAPAPGAPAHRPAPETGPGATTAGPGPGPAPHVDRPVQGLTVLYDANCPLCAHIHDWLIGQRRLVRLTLIPAGSARARAAFPTLDHAATRREITVIGDSGQVWTDTDAMIMCLWALVEHRATALRLAGPAGRPFAKAALAAASAWRGITGVTAAAEAAARRDADTEPDCVDGACGVAR